MEVDARIEEQTSPFGNAMERLDGLTVSAQRAIRAFTVAEHRKASHAELGGGQWIDRLTRVLRAGKGGPVQLHPTGVLATFVPGPRRADRLGRKLPLRQTGR